MPPLAEMSPGSIVGQISRPENRGLGSGLPEIKPVSPVSGIELPGSVNRTENFAAVSVANSAESSLRTNNFQAGIAEVAQIPLPDTIQQTLSPLEAAAVDVPSSPEAVKTPAVESPQPTTTESSQPPSILPNTGETIVPSPASNLNEGPPKTNEASVQPTNPSPEVSANPDTSKQGTPENAANIVDKSQRAAELQKKVDDNAATVDEIKELRDLKKDPEKHREELKQKAKDGSITDKEIQELADINAAETSGQLTPEQQAEKLSKEIDDLGTEMMAKMANGEEITMEDLNRLRDLKGSQSLENLGFTPDQAKAAMREAVNGNIGNSERQSKAIKEVQEKIQELMAIELQLIALPKNISALREQRGEIRKKAEVMRDNAKAAKNEEERLQFKGQEYNHYLQMANINAKITEQKYAVPILGAKKQDLEQYVRRKVGATHGVVALFEFADAKARNAYTTVDISIAEEIDYRFNNY